MNISELRFLVAEDHDFQRRTLVGLLKRLGASYVSDAPDGASALELFSTPDARIDVIISDLDMPGMDGMELIRRVGESGLPVAIILASSIERAVLASVETMTRAYGITLLGAIEKPVTQSKLEGLISKHKPPQARPAGTRPASSAIPLEEIRRGLDNSEFEPFFQPKVDLASGEIKGAEALARWRHPERGVLGPYAFIDTLEQGGHIDPLTWMMVGEIGTSVSSLGGSRSGTRRDRVGEHFRQFPCRGRRCRSHHAPGAR